MTGLAVLSGVRVAPTCSYSLEHGAASVRGCGHITKGSISMAISQRLRFEILKRDGYSCRYCGATAPEVRLTVDHVTPVALGGTDDPSNLVAACDACNSGKSSVAPDADLVAEVDERSEDFTRRKRELQDAAIAEHAWLDDFDQRWRSWSWEDQMVPRPSWWRSPVRSYLETLVIEDILEFVDVAMNATHVDPESKFRYFCGCCKRRIAERLEAASDLPPAVGDVSEPFDDDAEVATLGLLIARYGDSAVAAAAAVLLERRQGRWSSQQEMVDSFASVIEELATHEESDP